MTGADAIAIVVLLAIVIAIGVYLLHWLYRRSSKNQAFVRTGAGGEKVVMGGGALVIPIIHDITLVNMNGTPIEIRRLGEQSFITRNKMRVDLVAEFFVRVIPEPAMISIAARTLGERTRDALALKEVIQGRLVDAMAAIAATLTMEEIHTNRTGYMQQVAEKVARTLTSNGLELENASLTALNQTDISVFDPSNAFDAEGLTQLTELVEERRKLRNRIENEARIDIKQRDFEAEQRSLDIERDLEYARIEQTRAIEVRKAAQQSEIEQERATSLISITNAKVRAEQETERVRITKRRAIEAERIGTDGEIRALEIQREKETDLAEIQSRSALESQRIVARQAVEADRIANERKVKELEIRTRQEVAVLEAKALADAARAKVDGDREVEESRIDMARVVALLEVDRDKQIRLNREVAESEQERAAIVKRYTVDVERLKRDEEIVELEITKNRKIKLAETSAFRETTDASTEANRQTEQLRIESRLTIEKAEIEQRRDLEIAEKERLVAVVTKTIEEAVAKTKAAASMKALAAVEEQIETVRAEEIANRSKRVDLIDASTKVEREIHRLVAIAKADKETVELRAEGEIAEARAAEVRYAKDAEGQRLLNESENMRSEESRRSAIYEHLVKSLPNIIRETVKPMERIESIKILQVDGLPGLNSPSETGGGGGGGDAPITDRVVNSAMKYRTQVAFVDGLMKDLGLPLENLGSAGGMSFRNFPPASDPKDKDD